MLDIKTLVVLVETLGVPQTLDFREIFPKFSNLKGMLGMRTFLHNEVIKGALPQSFIIMADYQKLTQEKQHKCPMWSQVHFALIQSLL